MGMGSSERIDADKRGELSLVYVLEENTIKGKMEPEPAGTGLKYPDSCVSCAERYNKQPSAALSTATASLSRKEASPFKSSSGLNLTIKLYSSTNLAKSWFW